MKSRRKGFTLTELIVVIAILGILMAIVIPSWGYFMRRSRERTANAKAKVVFNAAQTEFTRIAQNERHALTVSNDNMELYLNEKDDADAEIYVGRGDFYFYWNGTNGIQVANDGKPDGITQNNNENAHIATSINNICGREGVYKVYVNNYNVQSVVYCSQTNGQYKGTYPRTMGSEQISDESAVRDNEVSAIDMNVIALNPAPAPAEGS
ncbi:type II secretion system protein [Ruminococcus sp.]|uniref:pilus assembly FimT family protein n=1 Tax=Ruminococcus sp. TaxID=41978 RepID=UPI0025FBD9AA|nr:type II secretion system protein [Ruminococcus sp.]MCR4638443.1 type II secretion system GspH family protein [Ruminococcus sp.]